MSLQAALLKAVGAAFSAVGDLAVPAVYTVEQKQYTPSTGATTTTVNTYNLMKCIFGKYSDFEVDRVMIHATDVKLTVQSSELTVTPNTQTDSVTYNGRRYNVLNWSKDVTGSVYTLQLRAP